MLKVWGRRNSGNVQKVMWLVGELGLTHDHIPAGGAYGRLQSEEFGKLNPNRRVPVIEDGDLVVWESDAILRYLAAKYGAPAFWPDDPGVRSLADRWMVWSLVEWQPAFLGGVFWGFYRTPEAHRDWASINRSLAHCADLLQIVEGALEGRDYLAGDQLTLADIPLGTTLYRYYRLEIARPKLPRVEAWRERLEARPAYRQHVMVPFHDLKGKLAS